MFLARLLALPFIMGGPRSYATWQVVFSVVALLAAVVWLAAPFAIWKAFGLGWLAFWLLPTGAAICGMGYSRKFEGGG